MYYNILVPVDGSTEANKAIEFACYFAIHSSANITILHVFESKGIPDGILEFLKSEKIEDDGYTFYLKRVGEKVLSEAEQLAKKTGGKNINKILLEGDPAEKILSYCTRWNFDMIVLGSHGAGREKDLVLGGVSRKVSRKSDVTCVIVRKSILDDKRILIVDDEPDILTTLKETLDMCEVKTASTFDQGKILLLHQNFDLAILDISGVEGFKLLEIAKANNVIVAMLTAKALTPQNTLKAFSKGAASFIPKDEMANIAMYLKDIFEAERSGKHFWSKWLERFTPYYNSKFGKDWQDNLK
jgi:nucleotide-binding universal stress UspA family protein/CheY-like chemotaxis protein